MAFVWGGLLAIIFFVRKHDRPTAMVVGACVVSHWILDYTSHRPDMPLVPGVQKYVGLGLWNSVPATIAVELAMFATGCVLYVSATRAKDRVGTFSFTAFIGFMLLLYAGNARGEAPPSVDVLAWFGLAQWLMVAWGYWINRHRETKLPIARAQSA